MGIDKKCLQFLFFIAFTCLAFGEQQPYSVNITVNPGFFERNNYVADIKVEEIEKLLSDNNIIGKIDPSSIRITEQSTGKNIPFLIRDNKIVFLVPGITSPLTLREFKVIFDICRDNRKYTVPVIEADEENLLNSPQPGENLLPNSGFEEEGTIPDIPAGWVIIKDNQPQVEASMKRTNENSHSGNYSLRWEVRGDNKGTGVEARVKDNFIRLKPNTSYIISYYIKIIDVPKEKYGPYFWVEFWNADKELAHPEQNKSRIGAGPHVGVTHNEWRCYTAKGITPPGTFYGFPRIFGWGGSGLAFIDDVELREDINFVPCEIILGTLEVSNEK